MLRDEGHVLRDRLDRRQRLEWVKQQASGEAPGKPSSCNIASADNISSSMHDFWKWGTNGELIRVHRKPRENKFTPIGVDCPVDIRDLSSRRITCLKLPSCLSILVPFLLPSTAVEGGFEESPGAAEQKRPSTGILGGITGLHLASQRA